MASDTDCVELNNLTVLNLDAMILNFDGLSTISMSFNAVMLSIVARTFRNIN